MAPREAATQLGWAGAALGRKVSVSLSRRSFSVPGRAAPPPLFAALLAADCPVSRSHSLFPGGWAQRLPGGPLLRPRARAGRGARGTGAQCWASPGRMETGQMLKSEKVSPEFVIPFNSYCYCYLQGKCNSHAKFRLNLPTFQKI